MAARSRRSLRRLAPALEVAIRAARAVLRSSGIPFALTGGIAVNIWGRQRVTNDVDFAVLVSSLEELEELVRSTRPRGFVALDPRPMQFRRAWVGRLLVDPTAMPTTAQPVFVDLIRPRGRGADSWIRAVVRRAIPVRLVGSMMPVVRPEDLVLFKLLIENDRGYDLLDARSVIDESGSALDKRYLTRTARSLGVRSKLRSIGI